LLSAYFEAWPGGRDRLEWPNLSYWCKSPKWARYSDLIDGDALCDFLKATKIGVSVRTIEKIEIDKASLGTI
jgi:hypothetical protein